MKKVKLHSSGLSPEFGLEAYRAIIDSGRAQIASTSSKARSKSLAYARYIRKRGYDQGYQAGSLAAQKSAAAAIEAIRSSYDVALDLARNDAVKMAHDLAEQLVDRALLAHPDTILAWINTAFSYLKRSRKLRISYHPRYAEIMQIIARDIPDTIVISADSALADIDLVITGESGGIEINWRESLQFDSNLKPNTAT